METPAIPMPRDPRERAILDKLQLVRDRLLLLKQDRTNYIRTQDVMPLFDDTMDQVKELTVVRAETGDKEENRCMSSYVIAAGFEGVDSEFYSG